MLRNIAVIGAGVSGLTVGYALKKIGLEVEIFERSQSIEEFGAGITLSKNATLLLQDLELMEVLSSKGYCPMGSFIRDYRKAKVIKSKKLDKNFITLDRRDLVSTLSHRFEELGGSIILDSEVEAVDPISGENINLGSGLIPFGLSTKFKKEKLVVKPKLYWRRNQDEYIYIRDNPEIYRNLHISNKIYLDLNFIKYYDSGSFSNFGIDNSQSYISSNNLGSHERFTSTIYLDHTFNMMNDKLIISPGFSVSYFSDLSFHFFPGLDLGYHISEKSKLYANFGKTYRIPTYTDLYYSDRNTTGNADLEPEHAISNELGFKYDSEKIKFSTSFFQRKSTNIIDYVKENESDKWKATNIRNLDTKGFDFDFNYIDLIRVGYTYLYDDSYVNDIKFSRYAINSFRHQLTSRLLLNYSGRLSQNLIFKYGERSDKSNHSVVDTNINYRLGNKSYLFISLNNIFDTSYSETNLVPMPGRNFLFGFINYLE